MTLNFIDIQANLAAIKAQLLNEPELSPTLKSMIEMQMIIIQLLANKLGLDSHNSSKPPSTDFHKKKKKDTKTSEKKERKRGGTGKTLTQVATPDEVEYLPLDSHTLPKGRYKRISTTA
jgi:transposase